MTKGKTGIGKTLKTDVIPSGIESGKTLSEHLKSRKLHVEMEYGIESNNNCIYIIDGNSFNWKVRNQIVRFNCKEDVFNLVKAKTGWEHIDNSKSDYERPFSFIMNSISQLDDLIVILLADY